jgi:Mrp family chromosome partitioning ATPase
MIAGGRENLARPELLGSERMGALVDACRLAFGFVVVDCPPLSPVADAVAMQDLLDGFLLVVRGRYTPREAVARAMSRLKQNRIHGVVFNSHPEILPGGHGSYQQHARR